MAEKPTTADDILRHLIKIHQAAADREDLPDWIRESNAERARKIRWTLEQPEEEADSEDLPDWVKIARAHANRRIREALEEGDEEE